MLRPGQAIDGFRLVEKLHKGGMAHIWKATRDDMSPPAILKIPIVRDGDDAAAIVGFEMEQMILPLLRGRCAPRFLGTGDFDRLPYIAMEMIDGASLLGRVDHMPLPVEEVAEIGAGVARVLAELHSQNVIHFDIKPSNIMRRMDGSFALIDYGLARHDLLPDLLAEEFRVPLGTGPYLSPEQVLRDRSDPRSDIFSLGVVLYYLLTGVRPFGYPRKRAALAERLWRDPEPPCSLNPACPPWLQEAILRCLEPEADQRYPTAAQLALDLANPDQIELTERAGKFSRDGWLKARRRWWGQKFAPMRRPRSMAARRAAAPIVLAAVDLDPSMMAASDHLRGTLARIMATAPGARLACVNVIKTSRLRLDTAQDEMGRNLHVRRLVELRHWAEKLRLPESKLTVHVLEASDPAQSLLAFAAENHVDQIVICACAPNALRGPIGPVATRVTTQAHCTVTLVRPPETPPADGAAMEPDQGLGL